jgi:hypothetical protein
VFTTESLNCIWLSRSSSYQVRNQIWNPLHHLAQANAMIERFYKVPTVHTLLRCKALIDFWSVWMTICRKSSIDGTFISHDIKTFHTKSSLSLTWPQATCGWCNLNACRYIWGVYASVLLHNCVIGLDQASMGRLEVCQSLKRRLASVIFSRLSLQWKVYKSSSADDCRL